MRIHPPPIRSGTILRRMLTRRDHFRSEVLCWVGGIAARATYNVCSREVGREMESLRVSMSHPSTRFLNVYDAPPFFIFQQVRTLLRGFSGVLDLNTLYIAFKTWLCTLRQSVHPPCTSVMK